MNPTVKRTTRYTARLIGSAAAAVLIAASSAWAGPTTFRVKQTVGSGSVVGSIQTDGSTGTLSQANIVGWDLNLTGAGGVATFLTSTGGTSAVVLTGKDLTATATNLLFDYGAKDSGYLLFQSKSPGLFSGSKYYCSAASLGACQAGVSVVPGAYTDASAQYDHSYDTLQVIGTAGAIVSDAALLRSFELLAAARTSQMLVNQLQSQLLLGLNEQVSCGDCGGGDASFGSFNLSAHGRRALSPEWTLFGGLNGGQYRQGGADVDLNIGFALGLQFDPAGMGKSRPYASAGIAGGYQHTQYSRAYPTGTGDAVGVGAARNYELSASLQLGWVDRLTPRDEAAAYLSYDRSWQFVGAYGEQQGATNPFDAQMPSGTDLIDTAGANAQYTHLFGRHIEADLNAGVRWAFNAESGVQAMIADGQFAGDQPAFVYYQIGGRLGMRVNKRLTVNLFLNSILAPRDVKSSTHGGFGASWSF